MWRVLLVIQTRKKTERPLPGSSTDTLPPSDWVKAGGGGRVVQFGRLRPSCLCIHLVPLPGDLSRSDVDDANDCMKLFLFRHSFFIFCFCFYLFLFSFTPQSLQNVLDG